TTLLQTRQPQRQRPGQPKLVGHLSEQRRARTRHQPRSVRGRLKQGAAYGYTKLLGYHPILATRAYTREVLHIRLRKGSVNTQKGMLRFTDELIARVTRAGATGVKLLRADSGFWNVKVFKRLEKAGWQYSIGVGMQKGSRKGVVGMEGDTRRTIR